MIEPTREFYLREGLTVALFGKETGNWNPSAFRETPRPEANLGLYHRLDNFRTTFYLNMVVIPNASAFSQRVLKGYDHEFVSFGRPGEITVRQGANADGVFLFRDQGCGIATGDCPTIVVYHRSAHLAIAAHAGTKSLFGSEPVLNGSKPDSVVDTIARVWPTWGLGGLRDAGVFVTCGISALNYEYPELVDHVSNRFGKACVNGKGIDLRLIIARMFERCGVQHITVDTIDTYGDTNPTTKESLWHSYRRDHTKERNLVLVVNR